MHVDLVTPRYHPAVGGIEDHVAGLAGRWLHHGHEVTVHTQDRDGEGHRLPPQGSLAGVHVLRYRPKVSLGYYTTRFEPRLRGDLVHLHGYGLWTNDWVARQSRPRTQVLTLHHGLRIPTSNPLKRAYHRWHGRGRARKTLERMRALIAITALDMERLEAAGYTMARAHLIPNGVPKSAFAPAPPHTPPSGVEGYFLFLGRLHREKEPLEAVRALAALPASCGLVVAGPDEGQRDDLEQEIQRLNLGKRVNVMGRVDAPRKQSLLAGARGLVLPSRYEAQGRVILEAWAQGVPVIASAVGGVPYLVRDQEDGLLHAWRDTTALSQAMKRLWDDAAFARRLGQAGRGRASAEFAEETLQDKTIRLCTDLVDSA